MRYIACVLFWMIATAVLADEAHANDLMSLYELAQQKDSTLQSATFQRDAAVETRSQALAHILPQVSATASTQLERATNVNSQSGAGTNLTGFTADITQISTGNVRTVGLSLSQTVWNYEAFNELKEGGIQAAAAEATYQAARQDLLLRVAKAYFAVLSAKDQLASNQGAREAFNNLLVQAKARESVGVGPHGDVSQAQAFYDSTEQSVIDAQNVLDEAKLAVSVIVGSSSDRFAPLRDDIPLTLPDPDSVEEWVSSAMQENFDLQAANLKTAAASRDVSAQRGKGLPTLSLVASDGKTLQNDSMGGNQTLAAVGLFVNWPLFQGGAVASAVRQSRALSHQAQADYDTARRDTERLTRAAFRDIVSGVQRIKAARRTVESENDAVEASRRNLEFGAGTEFDLLNAQNNYYTAQRAYNQVRYDYLTSVLTLKKLTGRLSGTDLAAVDRLLVDTGL
jgi:outer membrane protein